MPEWLRETDAPPVGVDLGQGVVARTHLPADDPDPVRDQALQRRLDVEHLEHASWPPAH